jgi:asparagine synthase (glutamine-hydrolysing)
MVYNGEIYNYRELRQELAASGETFTTESDSEVLLAAWARWGAACLPRLVGMFAFVIYDQIAGTLTAARDAFGIKPLFLYQGQDEFLFASEMPALLDLRATPAVLDRQRAYEYLVHGVQESGDRSFVEGVRHLPPAHLMRRDLRRDVPVVVDQWWHPRITENTRISFAAAAELVRERFLDNMRLHLRSDVPLGAALSGGIDSSAIVCAMRQLEPDLPIHTFSFVASDERLSEERYVDIVNTEVGAHPHKVRPEDGDLSADLAELMRAQGEPFCTTSMYAQFRVFKAARAAGVPVILEGQGGDEMLGGYDGYAGQRMRSMLERGQIAKMVRFSGGWRNWPGREGRSAWRALVGQLLPNTLYQHGLGFAGVDARPNWLDVDALDRAGVKLRPHRMARRRDGRGRRLMEVLLEAMTDTGLPSLLRYGDRNAMHFSVENRVPYLTVPFVELMLSLPEAYMVSEAGETKHVFRAAMRGIVPDVILDRRDKIGFETPMRSWLQRSSGSIRETLLECGRLEFLKPSTMADVFEMWVTRKGGSDPAVWRMVNLCSWSAFFKVT